ncbi:hypothetical protein Cni_G09471 [Canna indica]|uniref:EF-hand domain-containing protein n=1 Tax=Canna indica TaxID=4628 RepID=A0AAQ3K4V5_9LILI|nr:hypothetical protein Cni_G09471 [Canna indica]
MARRIALRHPLLLLLAVLPLLLLLSAGRSAGARSISLLADETAANLLLSDGVSDGVSGSETLLLQRPRSSRLFAAEQCEQTYGFLPCTTTVVGNLFLVIAYGFLMYKAATYLSAGSELLLEILGPGIVGGLFLPILGALPDAMLILVSGLSGGKETAQEQVLIGMGLLAGSTVMLLTVLWGSCVIVGKCDFSENLTSIDSQDTKGFSLFGCGITTDIQTSYAARIMAISIIPFVIVQLPRIFNFPSGQRLAVLVSLIVATGLLVSYCIYQVFQPWIQKRRLAYAKHKHVISGILRHAQMQSLGKLMDDAGNPNIGILKKLFHKLDSDSDESLSRAELRALIIGIQIDEIDLDKEDAVDKIMDEFDTSGNSSVEEDEFVAGISKWLIEAKHSVPNSGAYSKKFMDEFHLKTKHEHNMLTDQSDEVVESVDNPKWICFKAILLLLLGTGLAAIFADPLVDAVDNFSLATSIPSFFISFIAMPLATNSSEAVSAIIFATRKKQRTSSLTFSEIYGGVTMNNTLCLAVFLAIVYMRHLTWDFSAEVLIILIVCVVMGLFASFHQSFPLWTCFIAFLLYPLSLALVYALDFLFGDLDKSSTVELHHGGCFIGEEILNYVGVTMYTMSNYSLHVGGDGEDSANIVGEHSANVGEHSVNVGIDESNANANANASDDEDSSDGDDDDVDFYIASNVHFSGSDDESDDDHFADYVDDLPPNLDALSQDVGDSHVVPPLTEHVSEPPHSSVGENEEMAFDAESEQLHSYDESSDVDVDAEGPKGLVQVLEKYPRIEHRLCVRHIYANMKRKYGGVTILRDRMLACSKTTYFATWEREMMKLKELNNDTHKWLAEHDAHTWAKSHFSEWSKSDIIMNISVF